MGCCGSAKERYGTPETAAVLPDAKIGLQAAAHPQAPAAGEDPGRHEAGGSKETRPAEWQRPATWPPPKEVPPQGPDAPHVVLSTKFEEPWGTISRGLKEILVEKGCTVYNPNTDNKELVDIQ